MNVVWKNRIKVMLTCSPRAHVKEPKKIKIQFCIKKRNILNFKIHISKISSLTCVIKVTS